MPQAYIIEVHSRTAGIAVRNGRGYLFFAAKREFDSLDGRPFASPKDAERAAIRHLTTKAEQKSKTQIHGARYS